MPASAQVMMSTPNFYRLEIAYSELPYYNAAVTPALDVRNGFYHVSDAPVLGHELNPDYIAADARRGGKAQTTKTKHVNTQQVKSMHDAITQTHDRQPRRNRCRSPAE